VGGLLFRTSKAILWRRGYAVSVLLSLSSEVPQLTRIMARHAEEFKLAITSDSQSLALVTFVDDAFREDFAQSGPASGEL
jgi:hypothetical protein